MGMQLIHTAKHMALTAVTIAILIKAKNFQLMSCLMDCLRALGFRMLTPLQILHVSIAKLSLILMIFNYFGFKVAKRFIIENLFVIYVNLNLSQAINFPLRELSNHFIIALYLLLFATLAERAREIKLNLFAALCLTNLFIFLSMTSSRFNIYLEVIREKIKFLE